MMGPTHIAINAATWTSGVAAYQAATGRIAFFPATVGTLLVIATSRIADVDSPDSAIGSRVPRFSRWLDAHFGHRRSPFHWGTVPIQIGCLLCLASLFTAPSWWWVGLAVGGSWWLHIAADCLTWMGAPLMAPISMRMVRPRYGRRIQCGGLLEREVICFSARALWLVATMWIVAVMAKRLMDM